MERRTRCANEVHIAPRPLAAENVADDALLIALATSAGHCLGGPFNPLALTIATGLLATAALALGTSSVAAVGLLLTPTAGGGLALGTTVSTERMMRGVGTLTPLEQTTTCSEAKVALLRSRL